LFGEQYVARLYGYVGDQDPITIIEATPRNLENLIGNLPQSRLDFRPEPGRWSIREQVAHLADAELIMTARLRWAAAQPGHTVTAFDQDQWAKTNKYRSLDVRLSLATFAAIRRWTLALLSDLSPAEHAGWIEHEERGTESVSQLVRMMAGHDLNHLRQMGDLIEQSR
jgi:uncharacterized damage-inducible protein DinB